METTSANSSDPVAIAEKSSPEERDNKGVRIDILPWLARTTLDIIGLAGVFNRFPSLSFQSLSHFQMPGFNYRFDALNTTNTVNELNQAFVTMFKAGRELTLLPVLQTIIPPLRIIVSSSAIFVL